jgi:glucosylceramidase
MKHYRTSQNLGERLSLITETYKEQKNSDTIQIHPNRKKQTILGFGGAFTESSAYNLSRVNQELRKKAIALYFDKDLGLGYTMGRVSIHGCDFSLGSYLYIDDYDDTLESFSIKRDQKVIELIKDAENYAKEPIRLIASPWTPPFWMKDNQSPIFGGKLLPKYDQTWANYFVKFVHAYENAGTTIFGVTIQNEPLARQRWDSCIYDHADENRFLKVLGKTFEKEGLKDKKIMIWDHNRDVMVERAKHIYQDQESSQYAWGTAFHWYDQEQFEEVKKHHDLFPDKHLIFTEGCQENGPHLGVYKVGERYGRNMINDLKNYTEAYIEWNLFLDDTGGPNHVNNLCSAPIIIKIFQEELILNPSYYYIGHFSKFIQVGAVQLESTGTKDLYYVSFLNPDGSVVIVVQNESESDISLTIKGLKENIPMNFLSHSISTIII